MRAPTDLWSKSMSKIRPQVSNFQRNVFEAFKGKSKDGASGDTDDLVPVILKNIDSVRAR